MGVLRQVYQSGAFTDDLSLTNATDAHTFTVYVFHSISMMSATSASFCATLIE
jgi:hypothetical protein